MTAAFSGGKNKVNGNKEKMMNKVSKAFVDAQRKFAPALKQSTNPHFKSKYVDLAGCVEAVIDALNEHGIALMQKTHQSDNGVCVETLFIHESGETLSGGMLSVPASKIDPQGYGSALTYARRYSLMAACGQAPEDDDGNAATAATRASSAPQPEAKPAQPLPVHYLGAKEIEEITRLAPLADRTIEAICAAHKVDSLAKIPMQKFASIQSRLIDYIDSKESK